MKENDKLSYGIKTEKNAIYQVLIFLALLILSSRAQIGFDSVLLPLTGIAALGIWEAIREIKSIETKLYELIRIKNIYKKRIQELEKQQMLMTIYRNIDGETKIKDVYQKYIQESKNND